MELTGQRSMLVRYMKKITKLYHHYYKAVVLAVLFAFAADGINMDDIVLNAGVVHEDSECFSVIPVSYTAASSRTESQTSSISPLHLSVTHIQLSDQDSPSVLVSHIHTLPSAGCIQPENESGTYSNANSSALYLKNCVLII